MIAIAIRAPWADQIVRGIKKVEYRTWRTPHRGDLAIYECRPVGAIIGIVDLVDIVGEPGDWEWILENPRRIEPIKCRGKLRIFQVEINASSLAPSKYFSSGG